MIVSAQYLIANNIYFFTLKKMLNEDLRKMLV